MSRELKGAAFASILTKRPRFTTDPGSREANDYEIQIDKKGHKVLKQVGTHDIYEEIQSYYEETKIENIIARASAGDMNALNQRMGFYADITKSPANLAEAQNAILRLAAEFDRLPTEIRAKFDNSKEMFVHEYGTPEFMDKMGWNTNSNQNEKIEFVPGTSEAAQPLTPEGE